MNLDVYRKGHKDYAIVIDKTGKIRGMFDATSKSQCERLHTRLLECLAEEPPSDLASSKDKPEHRQGGEELDVDDAVHAVAAAHPLVHVNATLNAVATVLLVVGLVLIKQRPRRRRTSARC